MAHLFIRDPIAVYAERLEIHDENDTDHFEVGGFQLIYFLEHSIDQLAINEIQAPSTQFKYWLAG